MKSKNVKVLWGGVGGGSLAPHRSANERIVRKEAG